MSDPLRVLVVEDSEEDCDLLLRELRRSGWTPEWERVETAAAMSRALGEREWDVVISDFRMPAFSAPAALELLQASGLDVPFLIVSGTVGEEAAVEALKSGADDFLLKQKLTRLASAVRRELREAANRRARRRAEAEKAEAERRLRHAQKLEAVGRLAGGIAHDFNNVLQAMLALVQLLRLGGPRHDLDERLAEMESHVRRGAQLTRQLLLFSRHEAPSRRRVDACGVLDGAGAILRRLIPATIDTRVERPAEAVAIEADPGQLEQVLMNLAINAADAMPEGGVLTLRLEQPDASRVVFTVADTGTGMSQEVLDHLFEPFFTTKGSGKGTGLGLSVVHGIVAEHGGSIEVDSAPGRGTTFRLTLPRCPSGAFAALPGEPAPRPVAPRAGARVLVAEDETGARASLLEILTLLGHRPCGVGSAEEAERLPADPGFDVLLTDLELPGVSGVDLAVRAARLWPGVRVILMSGYVEEEARTRAAATGAAFLQKPFDVAALERALAAALGGSEGA